MLFNLFNTFREYESAAGIIACRSPSVGRVSRFVPVLNGGEAGLLSEYAAQIWRVVVMQPFGYFFYRQFSCIEEYFDYQPQLDVYLLFCSDSQNTFGNYIQVIGRYIEFPGIESNVMMVCVVAVEQS